MKVSFKKIFWILFFLLSMPAFAVPKEAEEKKEILATYTQEKVSENSKDSGTKSISGMKIPMPPFKNKISQSDKNYFERRIEEIQSRTDRSSKNRGWFETISAEMLKSIFEDPTTKSIPQQLNERRGDGPFPFHPFL